MKNSASTSSWEFISSGGNQAATGSRGKISSNSSSTNTSSLFLNLKVPAIRMKATKPAIIRTLKSPAISDSNAPSFAAASATGSLIVTSNVSGSSDNSPSSSSA